jgi:nucleotide-binding universal stress UspA family protein
MLENENLYYKLVNTYDLEFSGSPYVMQVKDELAEESLKGLRNELQLIHRLFPSAKIELASRFGPLIEVIKDEINEYHPDLVVLGNKGESAIEHFLLGSNAYEIIKSISIPLLVVPQGAKFRKPEKIVFATDLNDFKSDEVIKPVREIVNYFNAELLFAHVLEESEKDRFKEEKKILSHFPDIKSSFHYLQGDNVAKSICDFVDEQGASMVIMIRHNKSFFDRIIHSSTTKQMILHPKHTLVVLHDEPIKE